MDFDLDRMYEQLKAIEVEERKKGRAIAAPVARERGDYEENPTD